MARLLHVCIIGRYDFSSVRATGDGAKSGFCYTPSCERTNNDTRRDMKCDDLFMGVTEDEFSLYLGWVDDD